MKNERWKVSNDGSRHRDKQRVDPAGWDGSDDTEQ